MTMELHKHAKQRCWERFGVILKTRDMNRMIKDIDEGIAQYIGKGKLPERTIYRVRVPQTDQYCRVVYHSYRKYIVTCMRDTP